MDKDKQEKENNELENDESQENTNDTSSENSHEEEIKSLKKEIEEHKDKYLRLYADFENLRKRAMKEKIEQIKLASEELIVNLLPVLDDLERAQQSYQQNKNAEALEEGIQLIYQKFLKILEQRGLKPIISKGEIFNIEMHEAITQIPVEDETLKGKVMDEMEKGYYLHEKVIRFAKVIIGN